jgi:hypothetical protein
MWKPETHAKTIGCWELARQMEIAKFSDISLVTHPATVHVKRHLRPHTPGGV